MRYIYEQRDWPQLTWDQQALASRLIGVRHQQGRLIGRMDSLGLTLQREAILRTLTLDVVKSSEIEGEILNTDEVRSSIARRLGIDIAGAVPADRHVEGVVEMMLDATQNFEKPLTKKRLCGWHQALFPTGFSGMHPVRSGVLRNDARGPMQVVSGAIGHEKIHFEAPQASRVAAEMNAFMQWANENKRDQNNVDPVLRAALAHFWFVTIHPFDDGNGRIARAIADWALAKSEGSAQRFYSMSSQIRIERNDYYAILESTQKATLDVTEWMLWFLDCLGRAIANAESTLSAVFQKANFWETHRSKAINERQRKMLNKLQDGFEGKLTTTKWATIVKCSQDTAQRDIQGLIDHGMLLKDAAGGRSTSYSLVE